MKNKSDKNALTVGIAVSAVILVCLAVVSQNINGISTENEQNDNYSQNHSSDSSNISVNDVLDILPQNIEGGTNIRQSEISDDEVPAQSYVENEDNVPTDIADNSTEEIVEDKNSIMVSVDGYDLADAVWPVGSKEIAMEYSYNTIPVYSKTYGEYRSDHTGIDIKANLGEEVKCAYKGKVSEIYFDDRLGMLVKVEHAEGIYSVYANLDENVNVTLNQKVAEGDVLGTVGTTAASESAEETHLHFGVIAFGGYVNPLEYIKQ